MRHQQRGFAIMQGIMAVAVIGGVAAYAIPAYDDFLIRSKVTEAFTLAGDTKNRLTEFYVTNARFPKSENEHAALKTEAYTPPEFVHDIQVDLKNPDYDAVIQVYFKDGAIPGAIFEDDYVFLGGVIAPDGVIEWKCGADGIVDEFLPERCQSKSKDDDALMEKYDDVRQSQKQNQIEGARDRMPSEEMLQ
ncbi:MAG: pilin [Pseudomonadota bacterium]